MSQNDSRFIASVRDALIHASTHLEQDLVDRIVTMRMKTATMLEELAVDDKKRLSYETSIEVLDRIQENLQIAAQTHLPMCQDTGMVIFFVEMGVNAPMSMHEVETALHEAVSQAVIAGNFRASIVKEPVFDRENTQTNLPPIIHWFPKQEDGITVRAMLKGFGSENCSGMRMLNPTAGADTVLATVVDLVRAAGGKPCPPIVVGIGLGGSAERSAQLAKKALFRPVGESHPEARYAGLEQRIESAIQDLYIGPGGFGGPLTALAVAIEYESTHIAGLPVSVAISCWADRKAIIHWGG